MKVFNIKVLCGLFCLLQCTGSWALSCFYDDDSLSLLKNVSSVAVVTLDPSVYEVDRVSLSENLRKWRQVKSVRYYLKLEKTLKGNDGSWYIDRRIGWPYGNDPYYMEGDLLDGLVSMVMLEHYNYFPLNEKGREYIALGHRNNEGIYIPNGDCTALHRWHISKLGAVEHALMCLSKESDVGDCAPDILRQNLKF